MAKLSKATIAAMEANRDRVQEFFDGTRMMHTPDREFSGVTFPRAVLLWGGRSTKPYVLDPKAMKKGWQKKSDHAQFVFWDVDLAGGLQALTTMSMPGVCIGCGTTAGVSIVPPVVKTIQTMPKSTRKYQLRAFPPGFGAEYCERCATHALIDVAHQEDGDFLSVTFAGIDSPKAYVALSDANAEHAVPYFEMIFSAQADNNLLYGALKGRS